ncbi:MAG TPA: hypothetical protein PKD54_12440, partial [Pirellulaceae bacterium]|nr:hypothetical protein [Pirellulaceae bacterium]
MSAVKPYPLQFIPVMQQYLWGGWKLRDLYRKGSGAGTWAESWEVVDHAKAQSIVRHGPLHGWSLQQVMAAWGPQLVGQRVWEEIHRPEIPESLRGRFPLLLKFLDARLDLSVQVHPNDRQAALLDPPDLGKSEAWIVLQADPGARIYAGTKPNVSRKEFQAALAAGSVAD